MKKHTPKEVSDFLAKIGRKGGSANTDAQNKARAKNAKKGGYPKGRPRKGKA